MLDLDSGDRSFEFDRAPIGIAPNDVAESADVLRPEDHLLADMRQVCAAHARASSRDVQENSRIFV
jgi:hypothetical protein